MRHIGTFEIPPLDEMSDEEIDALAERIGNEVAERLADASGPAVEAAERGPR